ncbi:MAG: hypothetical protein WAN51_05305 [Alphaproteobacteria bacterium]
MKRFAKVGGEMVPLDRVEAEIAAAWLTHQHAVVAIPDPRKGEQLALLTNAAHEKRSDLPAIFRAKGLSDLFLPRLLILVDRIPLLGSGKTDYPAVMKLVMETK